MIISNIYKRAFNVLSKMPFKLWGLSLLSSLLTILVLVFGVLPIVIVPVIAVLSAWRQFILTVSTVRKFIPTSFSKVLKIFGELPAVCVGKSYGFSFGS